MALVSSHLRSLATPDGAVILDSKQNVLITVNPVGAYVWSRLEDGKSVESIIHNLASDTGTDAFIVERDVLEFIEELTSKHLFTSPPL